MRYSYQLSQTGYYEKGQMTMHEQELMLLGGWAKALKLRPISSGVMKPLGTVVTSISKPINVQSSSKYIEVNSTFNVINVRATREYTPFSPKIAKFLTKFPPERLPMTDRKLFREYLKKVASNPLERMMWVCLDWGHEIKQLVRDDHVAYTYELLRSEDIRDLRMAEEVMQRTLGIYEVR